MARYPKYSNVSYSFGPGPLSPAIKALIIANVVVFLLSSIAPVLIVQFALVPAAVFEQLAIWRPVTYLFLHGGIGHLLFNMLSLWMFGTDLERMWGTRFFTKYYFVCGVGAAVTMLLWAISPLPFAAQMYTRDHHRRVGRDLRRPARLRACTSRTGRCCSISSFLSQRAIRDDHRRDRLLSHPSATAGAVSRTRRISVDWWLGIST